LLKRESQTCDPAAVLGSTKTKDHLLYLPGISGEASGKKTASPADAFKVQISQTINKELYGSYNSDKKRLRELLSKDLDETQKDFLETHFPLFTMHVYCAPCA
jgi:hypothetical protein